MPGRPGGSPGAATVHARDPGGLSASDTEAWERRLGHIWARQLRRAGVGPDGTVIEIGPGFSAKVGFGLAEIGFRGELILVEPNAPALRWAANAYQLLLPQAAVHPRGQPMPDAGSIKGPVTVLLANHLLDDLLVNAYVQAPEKDRIFGAMRPGAGCPAGYAEIWRELSGSPGRLSEVITQVTAEFAGYVAELQPDCLILNDYPSWQHHRTGLGLVHQVSHRAMRCLHRRLARTRPVSTQVQRTGSGDIRWLISVTAGTTRRKARP